MRNCIPNSVFPQPDLPQTRVGLPRGSPPPVISSIPSIPVGLLESSSPGVPDCIVPIPLLMKNIPSRENNEKFSLLSHSGAILPGPGPCACITGSVKAKVLPSPSADSTQILPPVTLYDPPADGETDTCPGILIPVVESLEDLEDFFCIERIDTDPVVLHRDEPGVAVLPGPDTDYRRLFPSELDRVREQVLEYLDHLGMIGEDRGEHLPADVRIVLLDAYRKVPQGFSEHEVQVGPFQRLCPGPDPGRYSSRSLTSMSMRAAPSVI